MSHRPDAVGGKYVPVRPLAAGGMAEVDLARQVGIDGFEKLVVLKRIRPEFANDAEFVTRFLDEARTVADLRHPNLVQVYEAGRDGSGFYLAMAFVHGASVRQMTREAENRKERVPLEHAVHVVMGAARGLHYAHEKANFDGRPLGIVHRDVSPQNLLVSFQGEVKVADFGIAQAANQQHLTRPGHIWGKLDYMAPEQARGGVVSAASDQFALAIVAWELFSGERLFRRDTDAETLRAVLVGHVPSIATRVPGFPPALERALERALAGDPAARYPSCAAFAAELEQVATRIPLLLSEGRLGEYLRGLFPTEAAEVSLPLPPLSPTPRPGATAARLAEHSARWLRRRRVPVAIAGAGLVVAAASLSWLWSEPRLVREAEAQLAAGNSESALQAALQILSNDPGDERGLAIAGQAATRIAEARSVSDPENAKRWLEEVIDRHPSLGDSLRTELLVLEVRTVGELSRGHVRLRQVAEFVYKHESAPEVALAAADMLRQQGVVPAEYIDYLDIAIMGKLPPEARWFDEAMDVLKGPSLPLSEEASSARRVAERTDRRAFDAWGQRAILRATEYELLNAIQAGFQAENARHLGYLRSITNSESPGNPTEFIEGVWASSEFDRRRIVTTMRVLSEDSSLRAARRDLFRKVLQKIETPPAPSK